jgi:hypothetical protein
MNRPFTVYFDTNFYIWLAKATDEEANNVISKLNQLKVRHVLSGRLLFELLSGKQRDRQDQVLVERIKKFEIEPLTISINSLENHETDIELNWEALLLRGEVRNALAEFLKAIFDMETLAQSLSNMTNKKLSKSEDEKLQENLQPFLSSIGFDEKFSMEKNAEALTNFASDLISNLSHILPNEQKENLEKIDFSVDKSPENILNISNQLLASLGPETVEKLEEERKIIDSSVKLDPRPYKVAVSEASNKEIKNLGNTYRDAEHINLFVTHQDQIDLIQIDFRQKNLVERKKPIHRLNEIDLSNRCFSANNLLEAMHIIENKEQEFLK